jgi:uncharacterized protein (TIGR02118 family)
MVRFVSTFRLKEGYDREESFRLWHEVHTPRVIEMLKDYGLKRYVIAKLLSSPEGEPEFFGMARIWFDNLENAKKGTEYMLSQRQDAFTDRITDTRRVFVVEEKEIEVD